MQPLVLLRRRRHRADGVFEGGGVKGIAFAGAIAAAERDAGVKEWVNLAGTSAGSIVSALLGMLGLGLILRREAPVTEAVLNWMVLLLLALLVVVLPWLIGRYRAQQALLVSAGWERVLARSWLRPGQSPPGWLGLAQ